MPCCEGHAPVAKVAIEDAVNVLARFLQSGKCDECDKSRSKPPVPRRPKIASRYSPRNCSKITSTNNFGRLTARASTVHAAPEARIFANCRRQMSIKKEFITCS